MSKSHWFNCQALPLSVPEKKAKSGVQSYFSAFFDDWSIGRPLFTQWQWMAAWTRDDNNVKKKQQLEQFQKKYAIFRGCVLCETDLSVIQCDSHKQNSWTFKQTMCFQFQSLPESNVNAIIYYFSWMCICELAVWHNQKKKTKRKK